MKLSFTLTLFTLISLSSTVTSRRPLRKRSSAANISAMDSVGYPTQVGGSEFVELGRRKGGGGGSSRNGSGTSGGGDSGRSGGGGDRAVLGDSRGGSGGNGGGSGDKLG